MYSPIATSVQQGQPVSLGALLVCVASNCSVSYVHLSPFSVLLHWVLFMHVYVL